MRRPPKAPLSTPVAIVFAVMADGMTTDEILADLPDLEAEDIAESEGLGHEHDQNETRTEHDDC